MQWFFQVGDKWSNYDTRYNHEWHCDVMDALSGFGAAKFPKLREAAACLRLPGKVFGTGREVYKMYQEGKHQEIKNYCEMDVLETFLMYLKWQFLKGIVTEVGYLTIVSDLIKFLREDEKEKPHYRKFIDEWLKVDQEVADRCYLW
jgi:predicted PolB exonuclease-like 3'-5' exonuclease